MVITTNGNKVGFARTLLNMQVERSNKLSDEMSKPFWSMIGTANQCAYIAMDEAVEAMQGAGMMKHQVKVKATKAIEEYKHYERLVYAHFHEMQDERYYLWCDMVSRAADALEGDIKKLYFAIKNVIDRYNVANSDVLAKIQTAMALISLSCLMYDTMAQNYQRQTMIRISDNYAAGRLTAVENLWRCVGDMTGKQVLAHIDLSHDEACSLGIRVLLTRYEQAEFLNDAAGEALRLNPNCEKYLNEE